MIPRFFSKLNTRTKNYLLNHPNKPWTYFVITGYGVFSLLLSPKRLYKNYTIKKIKLHNEKKEAEKISQMIDNQTIKQALVVFDNFSSPPTIGDFFLVVMIARYF